MDKKSIFAMVLIAVVILTLPYYQKLIQGDQPQKTRIVSTRDSVFQEKVNSEALVPADEMEQSSIAVTDIKQDTQKIETSLIPVNQDSSENFIEINTDKIHVVLSNKGGGSIQKFVLKNYSKYDSSLVDMIDSKLDNDLFLSYQDNEGQFIDTDSYFFFSNKKNTKKDLRIDETFKIEYLLKINSNEIRKTYIFYGDHYHFDVVVSFSNPAQMLLNRQYQFGWKNGLPSTESYVEDDNNYNQAFAYMGDELESYSVSDAGRKETVNLSGNASWLAVRTKYFIASIVNRNADVSDGIYFSGLGIQQSDYVQRTYNMAYNARYTNDMSGDSLRVYIGPMDHKELGQYEANLDVLIMNNGWYERMFRFFSLLILPVLEFLYGFIPNYGIVIIIFSVLVKIVVYPLTKKSYTSMKEMQNLQPIMAEMREKYKNDAQRLNKEMMKLYKDHKVNPLGGCLPTLLQMPLLIALFITFRSTIQLRGASFIPGWIDDLSRTDTLFNLPFSLPMYGDEFNLLPILMAVTMIFQSKMTMQDPKQKAMVYMMPIFMLLIFNRFPSGLNLYYTMFNLLTIIQQKFISKGTSLKPELAPAKPDKKGGNKKK